MPLSNNVPLIRDLRRCRRCDYAEASKEVFATVLFAVLPVWLGAILIALIPKASVGHYVGEFFGSGEALLVAAALVGPSIYIITKRYGDFPKSLTLHFPQGWFFIVLWLSICMIITAIFGLQRISNQFPSVFSAPLFDLSLIQWLSACLLVIAVATLYLITAFRNFVEEGAAAEMHSEEQSFLKEWGAK